MTIPLDVSIVPDNNRVAPMAKRQQNVTGFRLTPGQALADRYRVEQKLGSGWEGEVYKIVEIGTGIERAAKLFFPQRNPQNRTARRYALKLHKLRHCGILIQYVTQEFIELRGQRITMLVSEFVEGELLSELQRRQRGGYFPAFEALHLVHAIAQGIAEIHQAREYHGDLHTDNIIVRRFGLRYEIKVIDLFHWNAPKRENIQHDVCEIVRILHELIGGARRYRLQTPEIKAICCGLKHSLILKKFRTAGQLRDHIESIDWH
ncbi:MAG: protein kinase domain-containing protein [Gammaproteobacteria bacterium]